jgi:hypothetical protein
MMRGLMADSRSQAEIELIKARLKLAEELHKVWQREQEA